MKLCGERGFAGPSGCVEALGHDGAHRYGDYAEACLSEDMKDVARYRWLRDNYAMLMCNSGHGTYSVTFQPVLRSRGFTSEQLDAAIDAAMASETPNVEAKAQTRQRLSP